VGFVVDTAGPADSRYEISEPTARALCPLRAVVVAFIKFTKPKKRPRRKYEEE